MEENKNIEEVLFEEVDRENEKRVEPYYDVLPIKNKVLFPSVLLPIAVSKKSSLKLIKAANKDNRRLILLTQKDNKATDPKEKDLYTTGVLAHVLQIIPVPEMGKDTMMTIFETYQRVQVSDFMEEDGQLMAHAFTMEEHMPAKNDQQFKATAESIRETVLKILNEREEAPAGLQMSIKSLHNDPTMVNYVCSIYPIPSETAQGLLEIHSMMERAEALLTILQRDLEELTIKADIRRRTAEKIDQRQREYFLQQEMETIKKDLGTNDETRKRSRNCGTAPRINDGQRRWQNDLRKR